MDNEYLEDLVSRARRMGALGAEYGGDCYHVTISMPDGTSQSLDAYLFDGDAFTGDGEHDMALLPDAIEQTVDDMVENCWVSPTDPIANIYGLLDEAASTGVSLDSECRDMSRASGALELDRLGGMPRGVMSHDEMSRAIHEAMDNVYGPGFYDLLSESRAMEAASEELAATGGRDDAPDVSERG